VNKVGGRFFEAAGIAILEGRSFEPRIRPTTSWLRSRIRQLLRSCSAHRQSETLLGLDGRGRMKEVPRPLARLPR